MHKAKLGIEGAFVTYLSGVMKFNFKPSEPGYMTMLDKLLPLTFPTLGNNVSLLEDGTSAYPKMLEAIQNANKHIDLQSFNINDDEAGVNMTFDTLARTS